MSADPYDASHYRDSDCSVMTSHLDQARLGLRLKPLLIVWASASATSAVAGPFGTWWAMPLGGRILFWSGLVALGLVIVIALRLGIQRWLPRWTGWWETALLAPGFTLLFTPVLWTIVEVVSGGTHGMDPGKMAFAVLMVPVFTRALRNVAEGIRGDAAQDASPEASREPPILRRLPETSGRRILRISVRDHYVEIVTDRAIQSVLMRFSDAIVETEGIPGLQVHRSHWVAEDAVRAVERVRGRMFLTLEDGSRVPVSRGFRDAVEGAGLPARAA